MALKIFAETERPHRYSGTGGRILLILVILNISCPTSSRLALPRFPGLPTIDDLARDAGVLVDHWQVSTDDGYLLMVHRLGNNSGTPVLAMHGLLNAADIWLTRGRNQDLVYMLLDEGFDVYLGNMRGNTYSKAHSTLTPSDPRFWDFSFHESGYYDLPAMIDSILKFRGVDQVLYLGHSLGTTVLFVMGSTRPEYNAKIRGAALTSPVAYLPDLDEFSLTFGRLAIANKRLFKYVLKDERTELFPRTASTVKAARQFCGYGQPTQSYCLDLYGQFFGEHRANIDKKWIPYHLSFYPTGSSFRTFLHLAQIIEMSEFSELDLGPRGNMMKYNRTTPRQYPLEKVTAPIALFWSWNDNLVSQRSVERIKNRLPNLVQETIAADPKFTHVDTYVGLNAKNIVYNNILKFFRRYR